MGGGGVGEGGGGLATRVGGELGFIPSSPILLSYNSKSFTLQFGLFFIELQMILMT